MKQILMFAALVVAATSCSTYGKLLKSTDYEAQYRAAMGYMQTGKYQKALTLFEKVNIYYLGKPQADTILFNSALALYRQEQYDLSGDLFDRFRREHDRSPLIEQAEYLYAMGHYHSSPEANRDQTPTMLAINAINTYIGRYPATENRADLESKRDELEKKLREKAFINAYTYYKIGYEKSAIVALRNALKEHPDSEHREDILYLIARASYEYASKSVETDGLRRERYLNMMDAYLNYRAEYPEGKHAKELAKLYDAARKYVADRGDKTDDAATTEKTTK